MLLHMRSASDTRSFGHLHNVLLEKNTTVTRQPDDYKEALAKFPRGAEGSRSQRRSCHPKHSSKRSCSPTRCSLAAAFAAAYAAAYAASRNRHGKTRCDFVAKQSISKLVVVKLLLSLVARVARLALVAISKNISTCATGV